jgi:lysophospholipase L1-like esterase
MTSRRNFLKTAGVASVAVLPGTCSMANIASGLSTPPPEGTRILFQGDSITDAGRDKSSTEVNTAKNLGTGYALLAASELLHDKASLKLSIYNKGISGNKVHQLQDRWEKDCIALKPDILSILIGVNDFWHTKNGQFDSTPQKYYDSYNALLRGTREALPGVKLIIGEPFALSGIKSVDKSWFPVFDEYRNAAKELATAHKAVFIPYQSIFLKASRDVPASVWSNDGVHTTLAGARLMSEAWLKAFSKL